MPHTKLRVLALIALSLATASGCGSADKDPAEQPAAAPVDRAFVNRMAAHTETSRRLAEAGKKRARAKEVRRLAARMLPVRETEAGQLRGLQERLGGVAGGEDPLGVNPEQAGETVQVEVLRGAKPFDRFWLQLVIQHHQGALALIGAEQKSGRDPATKALAGQLGQRRAEELNELTTQLARSGG